MSAYVCMYICMCDDYIFCDGANACMYVCLYDKILSIKVVGGVEEAMAHINKSVRMYAYVCMCAYVCMNTIF